MSKRFPAPTILVSLACLVLSTYLAASANSTPDIVHLRGNPASSRVMRQEPHLPALPSPAQAGIREDETGPAPAAPLGSARLGSSNAQAGAGTFYGNETLNPLIDSGAMIIPLPGGARVEIRDGETTYVLTDHLGSARVALRADNTVSGRIEYTPFGERQGTGDADVVRSYTGKVFKPVT